jgi:hypothetical protein
MSSESGAASVTSEDLARKIFALIVTGRRNLRTLADISANDARHKVEPAESLNWQERCQVQYSNVIKETHTALLDIWNEIGDADSAKLLEDAETHYGKRLKAYAERLDAERVAMVRSANRALLSDPGQPPDVT